MGTTTQPVPGWYRDPSRRHEHRWWDGTSWTQYVITLGLRSIDYGDDLAPETPDPAGAPDPTAVATTRVDVAEPVAVETAAEEMQWPLSVWCTVLLGAALLIAGAVLPWAEASSSIATFSRAGIDGNGGATLAAAIGIALLCAIGPRGKMAALLMTGGAVIAGAVGVHDALDISDKADALVQRAPSVSAGVGVGIWLTLAGATIALVGGVLAYVFARRA